MVRYDAILALTTSYLLVTSYCEAGQVCATCRDISRPYLCRHHSECDANEQCFNRLYVNESGTDLYELGCISQKICPSVHSPAMIGKRSDVLHFKCLQCCNDTALCNQFSGCHMSAEITTASSTTTVTPTSKRDCAELHSNHRHNGSYFIYPFGPSGAKVAAYCEYDSDGVWTVIQRRFNGSVDFFRNWTEYKRGFGSSLGEYWIGNDVLHQLTSTGRYKLKIELTDWNNTKTYAEYRTFLVADEAHGYRLTVGGHSGTTGDSMRLQNGQMFSTKDRDNDPESRRRCAVDYKGAWWYERCRHSNLNGVYHHGPNDPSTTGLTWYYWYGNHYSLKAVTMMVKK